MAVVRTEYDYAFFTSFQKGPHQKLFFDLKLQESKNERRTRLDEKYLYGRPRSLFNVGAIFLVQRTKRS